MKTCGQHLTVTSLLTVIVSIVFFSSSFATPRWTYEQIQAERLTRPEFEPLSPPLTLTRDRNTLDEIPYFHKFEQLCTFLTVWQYSAGGVNNGGEIEGESGGDENIIETDNTQESIREWSQYAIWTGDTARYRPYIERAKSYCGRFPAWHEGDGGFDYYSAHNIGWGFEAVRKYRTAYGDTSWNWYADSCAMWMVNHPLSWTGGNGDLNGYAEGLGLGGMYAHAVYRGRQDWVTHCINRSRLLRNWLQQIPSRMRGEVWALCGGTAVWGLSESLFRAYPDSGAMWVAQYGQEVQSWETIGQWNHSFCAWYANAQHRLFELSGDSTYWDNAVYIGDSLIGLDLDNDGGIYPGRTGYSPAHDCSWVSTYMGWMGMERIINQLTGYDLAVGGVVSPLTTVPYLAGDTLRIAVRVINTGWEPNSGIITVTAQNFLQLANVALQVGRDTVVTFAQPWVVADNTLLPTLSPIHLEVSATGDSNAANDTATAFIDIRRGVELQGMVTDSMTDVFVQAHIEIFHEAYPDSAWLSFNTPEFGGYTSGTRKLMSGLNRIVVTPPIEYLDQEMTIDLSADRSPRTLNFELPKADIALVDDDVDEAYETFYQEPLASLGYRVRTWDRAHASVGDLSHVPLLIWFTGDDSVTTLFPWDETSLTNYVSQGGKLIMSGQNITDDLGPTSTFMTAVLQCSTRANNANLRSMVGVPGNPISDGMTFVLVGNGGAHNQTSPSSIYPMGNAIRFINYTDTDQAAAVANQFQNGASIFLSFGFEAVSGLNNSTTREDLMAEMLDWLNNLAAEPEKYTPLATQLSLLPNYPNPFNPSTTISFVAPYGARDVSVGIYNLLGQRVTELYRGVGTGQAMNLDWNASSASGIELSSGEYVVRVTADGESVARPIHLIR